MFNKLFSSKEFSSGRSGLIDRQPCVAGQFYPNSAKELENELKSLFEKALPPIEGELRAIVSPHAGYIFSAQVAATAYNQVNPNKQFERIFLIGSSHRTNFNGASVYNRGNYITPSGTVSVDLELANYLIGKYPEFMFYPEAHLKEHCLEVQLPFLQYHLKTDFKIVPIIIATQSLATIREISKALKPFFNPNNLFVISSDFSHYPTYKQACEIDQITAQAIASNSAKTFLSAINDAEIHKIPGLSTAMCGWSAMLTLLNITEQQPGIIITPLDYQNSGDSIYGEKDRVVGYWAIAIHDSTNQSGPEISFTDDEKNALLAIARNAISGAVKTYDYSPIAVENLPELLKSELGVFVSVYVNESLRGCIGRFDAKEPLYKSVEELAVSAATDDSRFSPVKADELEHLSIELSVLGPLKRISSIEEIEPGKHGIYLKKGFSNGTFLPQVASKNHWSREELLGYCARDKAHIGWDGWKNAEIYTYEAIVFGDNC